MKVTKSCNDGIAPRSAGRFHLLRALSTMIKEGSGVAARGKEKFQRFAVLSGQDRRFCAFLPVFGVFRGEMSDGARGAVEKIGENGKIRSFRAFFTTLRFC